ncbi:MAG: hypothetical protein LBC47_00705 [Tannerella sp.]|jgi:hypothetical protein|nr:hypothetical protein [Tannerella sp.]
MIINKIKYSILSIIAASACCSCIGDKGDDPSRKTNSGYVAFDYTCTSFRNYASLLKQIHHFNRYYIQPTLSERDSVDRLYFRDAKIIHYPDSDKWTIHTLNASSVYPVISIKTNGTSLDSKGSRWTVSDFDIYYNEWKTFEFDIENKGDGEWHIPKHTHANDYTFEYTAEWNIRFDDDGKNYAMEGSGTLLSIETPKLKLDYTIIEPIRVFETDNNLLASSGKVKILATNVNKNLTEETTVYILSNNNVEITYNNHIETWDYTVFY